MATRRVKTGLWSCGVFLGCCLLAVGISALSADREELRTRLQVDGVTELSPGRYLVRPLPEEPAGDTIHVTAITRYPFGYAVVETGGDGSPLRPPPRPVAVRTADLAPGPIERSVVAFGTVEAWRDARVAFEVGGVVDAVHVTLGQAVAAGDPLLELDDAERSIDHRRAEAEVRAARAQLDRTRRQEVSLEEQLATATETLATRARERERWRRLSERGIASSERSDQADTLWRAARATHEQLAGQLEVTRASRVGAAAALEIAEAQRDRARLDLERCVLRAPFPGRVSARIVDVGAYVRPGTEAVRLVDDSRVRIRAHVREGDALALEPGATAAVTIPGLHLLPPGGVEDGDYPAGGEGFAARIEGVAAAADPATRKFAVDVVADDAAPALRPGVFARVRLDAGVVADALLIPDGAVVTDDAGYSVYVVAGDDTVARRRIELGPRQGEGRILTAGLDGPVELVVEGTALLFDGAPIARLGG